ncbi:nitrilase-related carbon-nitrogen hydrolase, partial [Staphylococcus capitis]|uniref:nitrilase-related carbon-nitrogen hydrolase n=1 Tax=Staphylococcus capitis TaxID=29388 RepID=UPI0037098055
MAKQFNLHIIARSVSNITHNNLYNTPFSLNKDGQLINHYHKLHLLPILTQPHFLTHPNKLPQPFQFSHPTLPTQIISYHLPFPQFL